MQDAPSDLELVVNGVAASKAGQTERQRLELPVRFQMFVSHAPADGAGYQVGDVPLTRDEMLVALEMARVKQLDRIADVLEKLSVQMDEAKRRA
jgi:hypothetical protein